VLSMTSFASLPLAASPAEVPVVDPAVAEGPFALMWLLIAIPLAGSVVLLLGGRATDRWGHVLGTLASVASFALGVVLFVEMLGLGEEERSQGMRLYDWIAAGGFTVGFDLLLDPLSILFVLLITGVGSLIHVYSIGYMSHDPRRRRFFAYLNLFVAAMLMLVLAGDYLGLFLGWEGVGLASYLLIGFWQHKPSAAAAAKKAFVINRVGDMGLSLAIMLMFVTFGTSSFAGVSAVSGEASETVMTVIGILLLVGACGKSAQVPLQAWLLDAMEGPTPVSALIHAATMVTAGVFMVARLSPLFEVAPNALIVVTVIGGITAFFAATIGMVQNDIKRVIAYSTCSQLGYMFFAIGVGAYQAAVFHLFTHAFFKALLFLSAGSVIHAMSDEQDIRKMGGIWKKIPITYAMFWIGSLALAGIPFFAGYYSKDFVLEAAFAGHGWTAKYAFVMGMIAALLTAFYSWRLIIMTFHGTPRADHHTMEHVHESPAVMLVPLLVLAAGALFAGAVFAPYFVGHDWMAFWNNSIVNAPHNHIMHEAHEVPSWVPLAPTVAGVVGIAVGYVFYMFAPAIPGKLAAAFPAVYRFLLNKWYFDELYDAIFVRPARRLAHWLWKVGDAKVIDGMPNGAAALTAAAAGRVTKFQTGRVANYAFTMIIGIVLFVSIFLFGIGR